MASLAQNPTTPPLAPPVPQFPGLPDPAAPPPATPGLINTAPGIGAPLGPTNPVNPVASYTPEKATAATAAPTPYDAAPFSVTPNQTAAGQIKDIIASGSPLMQQA